MNIIKKVFRKIIDVERNLVCPMIDESDTNLTDEGNAQMRLWRVYAFYAALLSEDLEFIDRDITFLMLKDCNLIGKKSSWRGGKVSEPEFVAICDSVVIRNQHFGFSEFCTILGLIAHVVVYGSRCNTKDDTCSQCKIAILSLMNTQMSTLVSSFNPTDTPKLLEECSPVIDDFRPALQHLYDFFTNRRYSLHSLDWKNEFKCSFPTSPPTEFAGDPMAYKEYLAFGKVFGVTTDDQSLQEWQRVFFTCCSQSVFLRKNKVLGCQLSFTSFIECLIRVAILKYHQGNSCIDLKTLLYLMVRTIYFLEKKVHITWDFDVTPAHKHLKTHFLNASPLVVSFKHMWILDDGADYLFNAENRCTTMIMKHDESIKQNNKQKKRRPKSFIIF